MRGFSAGPFSEEVERATMAGPVVVEPEQVAGPAAPEEKPEEEEPAWAPEPGRLYVFNASGEIILDEGPDDYGGDYRARYAVLVLGVELWNTQGRPGAPFRVVGGGPL